MQGCSMQPTKRATTILLLQKRILNLAELKKLERLRLVNVTPSALLVRPQCKIVVKQWGSPAIASPIISTSADYHIHTATWVLRTNM